jgi:hypothetical protein
MILIFSKDVNSHRRNQLQNPTRTYPVDWGEAGGVSKEDVNKDTVFSVNG